MTIKKLTAAVAAAALVASFATTAVAGDAMIKPITKSTQTETGGGLGTTGLLPAGVLGGLVIITVLNSNSSTTTTP